MTKTRCLYEDVSDVSLKEVEARVNAYGLEYVYDEHAILLMELTCSE